MLNCASLNTPRVPSTRISGNVYAREKHLLDYFNAATEMGI